MISDMTRCIRIESRGMRIGKPTFCDEKIKGQVQNECSQKSGKVKEGLNRVSRCLSCLVEGNHHIFVD